MPEQANMPLVAQGPQRCSNILGQHMMFGCLSFPNTEEISPIFMSLKEIRQHIIHIILIHVHKSFQETEAYNLIQSMFMFLPLVTTIFMQITDTKTAARTALGFAHASTDVYMWSSTY